MIEENKNNNDIKATDLFKIIRKYKLLVFTFFVLFTLISGLMAYFSTNIYQTNMTVKIDGNKMSSNDYLGQALSGGSDSLDNELHIIQSRSILDLTLQNIKLGTRYYENKFLKSYELYQNSPFIVETSRLDPRLRGVKFYLTPLDSDHFDLTLKPTLKKKITYYIASIFNQVSEKNAPIYYSKKCKFGEQIISPWFEISVKKIFDLNNYTYHFTIRPDDQMSWYIGKALKVSRIGRDSNIVVFSFQDEIPQRSVTILNELIKTYKAQTLKTKTKGAKRSLVFLDSQLAEISKELKQSAKSLQRYKTEHQILDVSAKAANASDKLSAYNDEMNILNTREVIIKNIFSYIENNEDITKIDLASASEASPSITTIISDIQDARNAKDTLLVDYTELHPDVLKVTKHIKDSKNKLISVLNATLHNIKVKKTNLQQSITRETKTLESLPEQEQKLTQLNRNFSANEKIYTFLQERRAEAAILESSTVSGIEIIDAPSGWYLIKPNRTMIVIIGIVLGLLFGVFLALLLNFLNKTIQTVQDIENNTKIPLYGVIPTKSGNAWEDDQFQESMRVLRTNLELLSEPKRSKLIAVTSSIASEGKSTMVFELCEIIALTDKKVISIDLDMRKGKLDEKYSLTNDYGMSTLLTKKHTLKEVIQRTEHPNLDVITAGPLPKNPSELIMTDELTQTINTLLKQYHYVIIDTPPIGLVTDAMMLMKKSDICFFVLRANFSKRDFLDNINKFVKQHELINAGIIFNSVQTDLESSYGSGYGYGYAR